jgi:hypothetical protein
MSTIPRPNSLVRLTHNGHNTPFHPGKSYLWLGEIAQTPGHCIVVVGKSILSGWHTDNFVEITEDELDYYPPATQEEWK